MSDKPILLIYSNCQTGHIVDFLLRSPSFAERMEPRWLFHHKLDISGQGWETYPADYMRGVAVVWEQIADFTDEKRLEFHRRIPPDARVIRFPAVLTRALFPFDVPEPHLPGRACYLRHGDRLASAIRAKIEAADVSDARIFEHYLELEEKHMPNVGRLFELDISMAENRDGRADINISEFIRENFRESALFSNGGRPMPILFIEIFRRLLEQTLRDDGAILSKIWNEVSELFNSYTGIDDEEIPVSPLVAERLGLKWFDPGRRYRWRNHLWTREQFIVNFIRLRSYII